MTRKDKLMRNRNGLTLIELMIVIAIIGLITAIALPNMIEARRKTNHAAAIATLRSFLSASIDYSSRLPEQKYWPDGTTDFSPYFAHFPSKAGYKYSYFANEDASKFIYVAVPVSSMSGMIDNKTPFSRCMSVFASVGLQSYDGVSKAFFVDETRKIWSADGINQRGLAALARLTSESIKFDEYNGWRINDLWFEPNE